MDWLKDSNADCLCVQETKAQDRDFPIEDITGAGYHVVFKGEKSYNGVATITTFEPDSVSYGFDGKGEDEGTRLISITKDDLTVVNTYVPQGTSPDSERFIYKIEWFKRLKDYFSAISSPDKKLIWCGDFNVAPEDRDVHNPKKLLGNIGFHPDEHKALAQVKDWGFVDVFRKHCDEDGQFSFWDYRARDGVNRGLGWRVDHIWATSLAADASVRSWIDKGPRLKERPSDHTPIAAEFDF